MNKIAENISIFLINNCEKNYDFNEIRYGLEIIICQLITLSSIILISFISDNLVNSLFYVFPLVFLRTKLGGFHFKMFSNCLFFTNSSCFFSIYVARSIESTAFYLFIFTISELIIISKILVIRTSSFSVYDFFILVLLVIMQSFNLFSTNLIFEIRLINISIFLVSISTLLPLLFNSDYH